MQATISVLPTISVLLDNQTPADSLSRPIPPHRRLHEKPPKTGPIRSYTESRKKTVLSTSQTQILQQGPPLNPCSGAEKHLSKPLRSRAFQAQLSQEGSPTKGD